MPAMNGRELAEALQRARPDTPVLYMSGYAAAIMTTQGTLDPDATVVSKPFTKAELLNALNATLTKEPPQVAHHPAVSVAVPATSPSP